MTRLKQLAPRKDWKTVNDVLTHENVINAAAKSNNVTPVQAKEIMKQSARASRRLIDSKLKRGTLKVEDFPQESARTSFNTSANAFHKANPLKIVGQKPETFDSWQKVAQRMAGGKK